MLDASRGLSFPASAVIAAFNSRKCSSLPGAFSLCGNCLAGKLAKVDCQHLTAKMPFVRGAEKMSVPIAIFITEPRPLAADFDPPLKLRCGDGLHARDRIRVSV